MKCFFTSKRFATAVGGVYTPRRQVRDFRGLVNTFDGDLLDRAATNYLAAVPGVSAAKTNVYNYGPAGRIATLMTLTASTATCRTNFYAYNGLNQLRKKDCPEGVLTYDYDGGGNLTNLQAFQRTAVAVNAEPGSNYAVRMGYGYDAANRLTSVTNGAAVTRHTFDKVGNLVAMAYPNGITNLYQYNLENRLTNLVWKNAGTTVASFAYTLGPTGLRTSLAETVNGTSRTHTWAYNSLYRLTSQSVSPTPNGNLAYQYDPVGNRISRSGTLSPPGAATATYNALDGLTTDTYDSNGNTVSGSTLLAGTTTSGFDAENRMVTLANGGVTTTMVYDPEGNRVSKTRSGATTWYLVDDRNPTGYPQVILEQTVSGGTTNLSNSYVYGLDLISQGPATSYYIYDGLGSTRAIASGAGAVQNTYTYDAYGTTLNTTGTTANNYLFAGEQYDPDLGLYYLRARYLQPNSGRFWTMDSYEGDQNEPISLNKYVYASDNPVNRIDPSGLADFNAPSLVNTSGVMGTLSSQVGYTVARANLYAFNILMRTTSILRAYEGYIALGALLAPTVLEGVLKLADNKDPVPPGNFPMGRFAERVYGVNLGGNYPVIDDWRPEQGLATSLRTHVLSTPEAYKNTILNDISEIKNGIKHELRGYSAPELGGRLVRVLPPDIQATVLVEIIPEGERALMESNSIMSAIRAAAGNIRVVIAPLRGLRK